MWDETGADFVRSSDLKISGANEGGKGNGGREETARKGEARRGGRGCGGHLFMVGAVAVAWEKKHWKVNDENSSALSSNRNDFGAHKVRSSTNNPDQCRLGVCVDGERRQLVGMTLGSF